MVDLIGLDLAVTRLAPDLRPRARRRLAATARLESVTKGTTLLREGRPTPFLGMVVEGRLALRAPVPGHPDATLMTLDAGDIFGWSAVLDGTSTASVVALDASRVLLLEREDLLLAISGDARLAAGLYRRLVEAVASRLDATRLQMLDLYRPGGTDR
jgi:CRP-like cAMP-binding protein